MLGFRVRLGFGLGFSIHFRTGNGRFLSSEIQPIAQHTLASRNSTARANSETNALIGQCELYEVKGEVI